MPVVIKMGNLVDIEGIIAIELLKIAPIALNLSDISLRSVVSDIPIRLILASINVSLVGLLCPSTRRNALSHSKESHIYSMSMPMPMPVGDNGDSELDTKAKKNKNRNNKSKSTLTTITTSESESISTLTFPMDCSSRFVLEPCIGVGIVRDVLIGGTVGTGGSGGSIILTTSDTVRNNLVSFINNNNIHSGNQSQSPRRSQNQSTVSVSTGPLVVVGCTIPLPSTLLYTTDFPPSTGSGSSTGTGTVCGTYPYYSSESHGEGSNAMKHRNNVKRKR